MALTLQTMADAVFGPSGANHSQGLVPDPGSSAGTARYLREDATFQVVTGAASAPIQRRVTSSPIVVANNDQVINVAIATGTPACALPLASSRNGVALAFKDVGGNFGAFPLTLTPTSPDTIDGLSSVTLSVNRQFINLVPANDGTTAG